MWFQKEDNDDKRRYKYDSEEGIITVKKEACEEKIKEDNMPTQKEYPEKKDNEVRSRDKKNIDGEHTTNRDSRPNIYRKSKHRLIEDTKIGSKKDHQVRNDTNETNEETKNWTEWEQTKGIYWLMWTIIVSSIIWMKYKRKFQMQNNGDCTDPQLN